MLLGFSAWAAEADSAPVAGMAGAGVANGADNGAIRRCPAAMLTTETYAAQVGFGFAPGWRLMTSVRDTRTSDLGAGLVYTRHHFDPEVGLEAMPGWIKPGAKITNVTNEESLRLGGGLRLGDGLGGVGLGAVWDRTVTELADTTHHVELDASAALRLGPKKALLIAATAHDLMGGEWGRRDPSGEAGVWWMLSERLGLAGDLVWSNTDGARLWQELGYRLGGQIGVGESLVLRGGGRWVESGLGAAGGLSIISESASLDYALDRSFGEDGAFWHTVGLTAFF